MVKSGITIGEIDIELPKNLIEVKSGRNIDLQKIAAQVSNLYTPDVNPGQKQVIVFAIDASLGILRRTPIEAVKGVPIGSGRYDLLLAAIKS